MMVPDEHCKALTFVGLVVVRASLAEAAAQQYD